MKYTVKQLSMLAKVSVRTLHHYDQIGLLKPAYLGDNNYRYYGHKELLQLSIILFYRELGLPLKDIQPLISDSDADMIQTLTERKAFLESRLKQTKSLLKSVDENIHYLRGSNMTNPKDLFTQYHDHAQEVEQYCRDNYDGYEKQKVQAEKHFAQFSKEDWQRFGNESNKIYQTLADHINKELNADSEATQNTIRDLYDYSSRLNGAPPNKADWLKSCEMYENISHLGKIFDQFHPDLKTYLVQAQRIYAENELS